MLTKTKDKKQNIKKSSVKKSVYPHIICKNEILNGAPIINGTRISVRTIAGYYQMGMNVDEILNALTGLTQSQVHSALAYYFDHQNEIDREINEYNNIYVSGKK